MIQKPNPAAGLFICNLDELRDSDNGPTFSGLWHWNLCHIQSSPLQCREACPQGAAEGGAPHRPAGGGQGRQGPRPRQVRRSPPPPERRRDGTGGGMAGLSGGNGTGRRGGGVCISDPPCSIDDCVQRLATKGPPDPIQSLLSVNFLFGGRRSPRNGSGCFAARMVAYEACE